jgi:hypothetical protein
MNIPCSTKGLAILAGGLAFVGSAQALDLIVNGSFEDATGSDAAPAGWTGACRGYNYTAVYFTGPRVPASENPGNIYSWRHRGSLSDDIYGTPMTQTVNLLTAAPAADIDAGRGQYTFSAWMASYGTPNANPEMPYVTVQFLDAADAPVGTLVALDRVTGAFFTTFADGVTVFDSSTHAHDWAKYVRTSVIPSGARKALVGIQHSPNAGLSNTPDTYTDLVKLDVTVAETRPSLDSANPAGANAAATSPVKINLLDGAITVNQGSIALTFDGSAVVPGISKVGGLTTIQYSPGLLLSGSSHSYTLVYADNGTPVQRATNTFSFTVANYVSVPASYAAGPAGSGNPAGLTHRSVQAGTALPNTLARARAQLAGTLIDPNTGQPFVNLASPGPNPDGSYNVDGGVNFEQAGNSVGRISGDQPFPGLSASDQDNFSTEDLFYLELPAGYYRFGVNSDDGFELRVGLDAVDGTLPSTVLGSYDGGRAAADSIFDFYVGTAGLYSMSLIFEEGIGGASCELYSVDPATGARTLVNDPANPAAIKAYRGVTGVTRRPYVRDTQPVANALQIPVDTAIVAHIWDGATAVVAGSVTMTLDGSPVVPTVTRDGIVTTVRFQPAAPLTFRAVHTVALSYGDGSTTVTRTWSFTTRGLDQPPAITGQWDFENGDLGATIGSPLEYLDGPGGVTAAQTSFGTTTALGLPPIAGFPAKVAQFPAAVTKTIGLIMRHGAVPNGTPTSAKVNQWTLIMDLFIPVQNGEWFSFLQIDDLSNSNDGDLFADFGSAAGTVGGIGITGQYTGNNNITKGNWHRVAFAVDSSSVITKFIDGVKFADQNSWDGIGVDGRHAMKDFAILLAENDGESIRCDGNSFQFRNYKMRDEELVALGGPDAFGIPTVSGQWDFDKQDPLNFNASFDATVGAHMIPLPDTEFNTSFTTVTIDGQPANIMSYGGAAPDGYVIIPGSTGNGGGQKINKYTLIMDLRIPASTSNSWHALLQTRTNNTDDASLFVRPANEGSGVGISGTYHGNILPDTWYRLAFTFDLTTQTLKKYTNGVLAGQQTLGEGVDGRWSTGPTTLLFADNDGDNAAGDCNSIQFQPRVLTDAEILSLGRPTAAGIPVSLPHPLRISRVTPGAFDLQLEWIGGTGPFQLQTRQSLSSGTWINLGAPTSGRTATVDRFDPTGFYQVIGQ